ncbi:CRISPR system precrRNA processing endoribonuclease RAMP protein Cas6 [Desulfocicer vacuolatum]|nr:CRISPR system precrRNA processing endoribonuclease RAMP protein Cas6 [Desulfocicer vacuolatum]
MFDLPALVRSRLGNLLKKRFCPFTPYQEHVCLNCKMACNCLYAILFSPTATCMEEENIKKASCHFTPPRPFTIHMPNWHPHGIIHPGETAAVELTLLGERAIEFRQVMLEELAHAVSTITLASKNKQITPGNGSKHPLIPLGYIPLAPQKTVETTEVKTKDSSCFGLQKEIGFILHQWLDFFPESICPSKNILPCQLTIELHTPLQSGRMKRGITFKGFISAVIGRLRDLKRIYHPDDDMGSFSPRFYELMSQVKTIRMPRQVYPSHYSRSKKKKIHLKGFHGKITFEGPVMPFIPLLEAGSLVGVGNKLTYGLGKYTINSYSTKTSCN